VAADSLNVLSRCAGQLFRITRAHACFGFMVFDSGSSYTCDVNSQVEHNKDDLSHAMISEISELQRSLENQEFTSRHDTFITPGDHNAFGLRISGKYIKNARVVPICDPTTVHAVIVLINCSSDKVLAKVSNVRPFVTATANLFSIKQIRNFLPAQRDTLTTMAKSGVVDILSQVYHPVIMFDETFNVTKYNKHSMLLVQQSSVKEGHCMREFLEYFAPKVAKEIIQNIENYAFNQKLHVNEWMDVPFRLNSFQSIQVDLALLAIHSTPARNEITKIDNKSTVHFALMINDNQRTELHSLQRFQALTSLIPLGILQLNAEFKCVYANDTWSKITSLTLTTSLLDGWAGCFHSKDLHRIYPEMERLNSQNNDYAEELQIRTSVQELRWVSFKSVGLFDSLGKIDGYIVTLDDISNAKEQQLALESLANTDSLTGISNRGRFHDRLRVAISRVDRHDNAAVLFIDLDKFKAVNDTYGHHAGDLVIQNVAQRLNKVVRAEDTIARLGGDEFAVIISDVKSDSDMINLAIKIIIEIAKPMQVEDNLLEVRCSIGVAPIKSSRVTIKSVLKHADLAVYKAKSLGRNQFCMYTESLERETLLANYLRSSLKNSDATGFFIEYQPQVNARTNEIVGVEALSRWQHPGDEKVTPQEFILQLETHGLINDFFVWQLSTILPIAKHWIINGLISNERKLSINLSAVQLHLPDLANQILAAFKKYELHANNFGLEVTETAFMEDPLRAGNNLQLLREAGFSIALDDFGTGFSSLSLLRKMPLDSIKIDKEFVAEILTNRTDAKIVQSMITLSRELELGIVAEGVENDDVKNWLEKHHCLVQQGFHFFKPMLPAQLESCLENSDTLH